MKKIDEVLIFRVPNDIQSFATMFPSQGVAVICDFLLENNINSIVYDLVDLLGKKDCYGLSGYISSICRKDCILKDYFPDDGKSDVYFHNLVSRIDLNRFGVVLISIEATSPVSTAAAVLLSQYIKKINKEIVIIVGGEYGDQFGYMGELFRKNKLNSSVDFVIKLNCIENIVKIIRSIEEEKDPPEMPSVIYYDQKKNKIIEPSCVSGPPRLGKLDFSNFNLAYYNVYLPDYIPGRFIAKNEERMLLLPVSFIFGCPHRCAFCVEGFFNNPIDYLEPREVVKVINELILKYKTRYFIFLNNTLNISYGYIDELCERIIESGIQITWSDCVNFKNLDKKILFKMKRAGAAKLVFGLETASNKMLEFCQKGITAQDAAIRLKWSHQAGIWNSIEIIAGLPYEQEEDIRDTIHFINSNAEIIDEINLNHFRLYPGSYFFEKPEMFGIENIKDNGADLLPKLKMGRNAILDSPYFRHSFDEKNGRKWVEKMQQSIYSYNKILASSKVHKYPTTSVDLQILLYLYGNIVKKSKIKKIYSSFLKRVQGRGIDRLKGLAGLFIKRINPYFYSRLRKII